MQIKKSSIVYRYLSWLDKSFDTKLTSIKSLCPLFWLTLLSLVLLPFVVLIFKPLFKIFSFIGNKISEKVLTYIVGIFILILLILVITMIVISIYNHEYKIFIVWGIGFIIYASIYLLFYLIGKLYMLYKNKYPKSNKPVVKDTSVKDFIVEGVSSIKNRVCPLIEYIDDVNEIKD